MKKVLTLMMLIAIFTVTITGCSSKTEEGNFYNKKYSRESMVTISGKKICPKEEKNIFVDKLLGFGLIKPDSWKDINQDNLNQVVGAEIQNSLSVGYIPEKILVEANNFDYKNASEEEIKVFSDYACSKIFEIFFIYRVSSDELKDVDIENKYANNVSLGKIGENNYFLAYNTDVDSLSDLTDLTDKDKRNINNMITSIDDLKNNIILFSPQNADAEESFEGSLNKFTTTDMDGNRVNQEIFKDYDITMVNIWTTWCGFCVEEMPELEELHNKLPKNVNLITICGDATDEQELAKDILADSNANFTTLIGNEELEKCLLNNITGFPTTIFVDSKGMVVGKPQVGAPGEKEKIIEGYTNLINEALSEIGK